MRNIHEFCLLAKWLSGAASELTAQESVRFDHIESILQNVIRVLTTAQNLEAVLTAQAQLLISQRCWQGAGQCVGHLSSGETGGV